MDGQEVVLENSLCRFLMMPQEVLKGSGVIVPVAHRETVFDLTPEEWRSTHEILVAAKELLDRKFSPDGYNIGWNSGETGGQHIPHAHLHVIPRFADEPYAGRGIRHWLKSRDNRRPVPEAE
ncbi:cell-cycle regulation histidine triad HIT protein [Bhargavaea cecembensis]|uniref:Cell-cycle regulation histidine triad HIT protein n=2 Tax=Bhargavaea cecembensis TaxID=394098 RepID=A0A163EZK3_9BACL|nr:cell-cycle regulation histidine triad HIT protein [Bhargavaea cecembensis]